MTKPPSLTTEDSAALEAVATAGKVAATAADAMRYKVLIERGLVRIDAGFATLTPAGKFALKTEQAPQQREAKSMAEEMQQSDRKRRKAPPMKETAEDKAVSDKAFSVTADELRQFIERAEQLIAEKADVAGQVKEVFAEAKGRGYDTKVIRKIIAIRKRNPDEVAEEDAILEMYKSALGMV